MTVKKLSKVGLVCFCVFAFQLANGQRRKMPSRPPQPRSYVQESLSTNAGTLKLIRIEDDWIGETNWLVALNGEIVYRTPDDVFGSVNFHTIFKTGSPNEVILMQETFNPGGCAKFPVVSLREKGKASVTDRFGNCSGTPAVTQDEGTIIFRFREVPTAGYKNSLGCMKMEN